MSRPGLFTIAPLLVFAALTAAFAFSPRQDDSPIMAGLLDRSLPDFSLSPIAGTNAGFASTDLSGKVALVNVFASWCSSCRQEHPKLLELAANSSVPIYGVNWKDAKGAGKLYLSRAGNPYVATGDDSSGLLGQQLNVTGVPETYLIDAKGRMRYRHLGPITDAVWSDILSPMITELEAAR